MSDTTEGVVIVGVKSHIWDARTSLQPEDLELTREQLPDRAVAGLGSKYTFDRSHLRPLLSARGLLYRTLKEYGISIGNTYVIPRSRYDEAMKEAEQIIANFNQAKDKLKQSAPDIYEQWRENVPERFRPQAGPERVLEEVSGSYLDTIIFEVGELNEKASSQLSDKLLDEVVQSAQDMLRGSFIRYGNRTKASQRILQPLKRLRKKIEGMIFIDIDMWRPILDNITEILDKCPKKGNLRSSDLSRVHVLLLALCAMRDHTVAEAMMEAKSKASEDSSDASDDGCEDESQDNEVAAVGQWF